MANRFDVLSITMDARTKRRVDAMAAQDDRTRSNMLAWLVNQEFMRRVEQFPTLAEVEKAEQDKEIAINE